MDVGLMMIFARAVARKGGLPAAVEGFMKAGTSLNLFAKEVLPVLKTWHAPAVTNAAQ